MTQGADVAIIGAGMAGASLAAEIASHASVLILEAEARPGYHSTGRSAAFWTETYGGPQIQPLTSASGPFLANPPGTFHHASFLSSRGALYIADAGGAPALAAMRNDFARSPVEVAPVLRERLEVMIPGLRPGWSHGLAEPSCSDIDVAALHAAYLAAARRQGAVILADCSLDKAVRTASGWRIKTRGGEIEAAVIVNAAGAWADEVARRAGETPLGIQPYRRTIVQLQTDPPASPKLPLVLDARQRFYFKPEAGGRLWLSPHDETPCDPCDSAAEEYDVALAIDRLQQVVDWRVVRVEHSWAGLRSFAPDRLPVYGFATGRRDFFWFAGQGGFGIQTAPAAAKIGASLLLGNAPDPMVSEIDASSYLAARFAN